MAELTESLAWIGLRLDDVYGARIGRVQDVYLSAEDGSPLWLAVKLGRFGDERTLAPVAHAVNREDHVWLPYDRQTVGRAPRADDGPLTADREAALAAHYKLGTRRHARLRGLSPGTVTSVPAFAAVQGEPLPR